ncbi:hypothetical protein [Streptomyces mirabilis]|uniref:hypothetical protein n=1 Tax=Streptomyces mirabilis TaxID=68239 RepID=UPI0033BD72D4
MPLFTNRQIVIGVGLVALIVLLLSCGAAVRDDGDADDCRGLGLAAAAKGTPKPARPAAPAAPRVPVRKDPAPARTARPVATPAPASTVRKVPAPAATRTVTAHPHGHDHGGVDVDLDVCG